MRRIYGVLLRLYPRDHRVLFASEMLRVFEQAAEERRGRGWNVLILFTLTELAGLMRGAGTEWIARSTPREVPLAPIHPVDELTEAQRHVDLLVKNMVDAIATHRFPKARSLADAERSAREQLRLLQQKYNI